MVALGSLTDDELIRYCLQIDTLTVLENELLRRFEIAVDTLNEDSFPEPQPWARILVDTE
jgi:hypothetical protein